MKTKLKKVVMTTLLATLISIQSASCIPQEESKKVKEITKPKKEDFEFIEDTLKEYNQFEPEYCSIESDRITEEKTEELIEKSKYTQDCTFKFDYNIEKLIETIEENSKEYLQIHPEFSSAFQEENIDGLFLLQKNFERIFTEVVEKNIENNTNDLNEDFCRMQSLKVVFGETDSLEENEDSEYKIVQDLYTYYILGYYLPYENTIVINYESIKSSAESELGIFDMTSREKNIELSNKIIEKMYYTISHELNHVRQSLCDCRKVESVLNLFKEASVDAITEAAAESEIYNLHKEIRENRNIDDYSYPQKRKLEAMLLLIAMTNNKAGIEDYYNAIDDTDFKALLDFFGINSKEDACRFLKILNSMDKIEEYGEEETCYAYRNEIFAMCLYNLVEYTKNNENFSLLDNVMMFNVVKNIIAENTYYSLFNEMIMEIEFKDPTFAEQFIYLEKKYSEFLSTYYKVPESEIRELEDGLHEYGSSLISLAQNKVTFDWGHLEKSEHLLKEFPLLKPILYSQTYYHEDANIVINYGEKLMLKKENM